MRDVTIAVGVVLVLVFALVPIGSSVIARFEDPDPVPLVIIVLDNTKMDPPVQPVTRVPGMAAWAAKVAPASPRGYREVRRRIR